MPEPRCTFGVQDKDGSVCYYEGAVIRTDVVGSDPDHYLMSILVAEYTKKWIACGCKTPGWADVIDADGTIKLGVLDRWICEHGTAWLLNGWESDSRGDLQLDWRRQ